MKTRSGNIELARFFAALLIMAHHIKHIGITDYPLESCWVYVEFFLLITGYYTAKHFDGKTNNNVSRNAVMYTLKKFFPLFPYIVIVTILQWLTDEILRITTYALSWKMLIYSLFQDLPFNLLFIPRSYDNIYAKPLWYVFSMFWVFPLFSLVMQIKNSYSKLIVCSAYSLIYYVYFGVEGLNSFPYDILRVSAGLMLGAVIYELSYIFHDLLSNCDKRFMTAIEIFATIFPVFACWKDWITKEITSNRFILVCFFISLLISLPGFSLTVKIKGRFFEYLGQLSMPIFILHWYIGTLVYIFGERYKWTINEKLIIYYVGSIVVSIIVMYLFDNWKWFRHAKTKVSNFSKY